MATLEGTNVLKKLANGKWQIRWRDHEGKQRAKNFRNKEAAQHFLRRHLAGETAPEHTPTFRKFVTRWLLEHSAAMKSKTTRATDEATLRLHLIPALGDIKLSDLTRSHLVTLRSKLLEKEARGGKTLSAKTVNNTIALAKTILQAAADWDVIKASPFSGVAMVRAQKPTMHFWTADERDRFVNLCRQVDRPFADLVEVATNTGLRLGELRALTRGQLDFQAGMIRVDATYSKQLKERLTRTKNLEVGFVPMNERVRTLLADRRLMAGDAPVFSEDLFPDYYDRLQRRCKQVGVRPIRFHDLRHTFASILVMAGQPLYAVQRLLRHKSISMTERYAHLAPDYLRIAAESACASNVHLSHKSALT